MYQFPRSLCCYFARSWNEKQANEMQLNRRNFFKICAGGMAGTSLTLPGFMPLPAAGAIRDKLLRGRETRNNCTYCSVGCGMLIYSLDGGAKNATSSIYHIEGDPGQPWVALSKRRWRAGLYSQQAAPEIPDLARRVPIAGSASAGKRHSIVSPA